MDLINCVDVRVANIDSEHCGAESVPEPRAESCKRVITVNKTIDFVDMGNEDIANTM